jgi:hypothetical protein
VTGVQEQVLFRQVRRPDPDIASLFLHLFCQPFQFLDDDAAARQPERQAGTHLIVVDEDFQFLAEFAMVAGFGFLEHLEIVLEFIGRAPGRAVDARQHFVVLVAAPISPGDGHELDSRRVDLARRLHVRTAAQVRERIGLVKGNLRFLIQRISVLVRAAFFQSFDEFDFVGLVLENLACFFGRDNLLHEWVASGDDLAHTLFDFLQVFQGDGLGQIEIVIEAVLDRRSDGVLRLRIELKHGLRHHMRGRVADAVQL